MSYFSGALISALALLKYGNLGITVVVSKWIGDLPMGAAIYGMHITSLNFVVLHVLVGSAYIHLTMALSRARNLLRPNNLLGDLTDDFVNNCLSFFE